MKKIITLSVVLFISAGAFRAQNVDSLAGFDYAHLTEHIDHMNPKLKADYVAKAQRSYIKGKYNLFQETYYSYAKTDSTAGCGNLDFENGSLAGWVLTGDFQLMSGSGVDPFGGFPSVCPGGSYSLRLNDNNTSSSKTTFVSSAKHSLAITSANSFVKVNYAAAVLNFPHPSNAAGFVKIDFLDQLNNVIPAQSLTVYYSNPPGTFSGTSTYFTSYTTGVNIGNQSFPVACVPWQATAYDLSPYIGQNVTIRLTVNWCLYNYDWVYAYFDVCCSPACPAPPVISGGGAFCASFPNTICAPYNMQNYSWSGPSGPISTASCISVTGAGNYSLTCSPVSNPTNSVSYVYSINPAPPVSFSISPVYCSTSPNVSLTATPSGGTFIGPGVSGTIFNPSSLSPGTYTLSYYSGNPMSGCSVVASQTTIVSTCTGIKEIQTVADLLVIPNPFTSQFFVTGENLPGASVFVLYNALGQELIRKQMEAEKNLIQVPDLPAGIYFYSLFNENQLIKKGKLIRE